MTLPDGRNSLTICTKFSTEYRHCPDRRTDSYGKQ